MPSRGDIGIFFGSWYTRPLIDNALDLADDVVLDRELRKISDFERTLFMDGAILVKFWFHLSAEEQKNRLESEAKVSRFKKSPLLEEFSRKYQRFAEVSERALRITDTGYSQWHIIEATDQRYRDITVGEILLETLTRELEDRSAGQSGTTVQNTQSEQDDLTTRILKDLEQKSHQRTVLDTVDLDQCLSESEYTSQINALQAKLHGLAWELHNNKRNAVLIFEGWDAAGKGSAIRRVTTAIDARLYRVIPIAAPTDEEIAHHYLWRFWRHIPRAGYISIYDRSWYGRVLVERVEKFAESREWNRAYQEINEFEEHLVEHGISLFKFWVHISPEEQLRRFQEREKDPRKQHKITDEDWRNREKWDDYKLAVNDMVAHTSTARTPWTLVAGNDKKFARVQVLRTLCDGLEKQLGDVKGDPTP